MWFTEGLLCNVGLSLAAFAAIAKRQKKQQMLKVITNGSKCFVNRGHKNSPDYL